MGKGKSKRVSCTGRPRLWEITRTRSPERGMARDLLCSCTAVSSSPRRNPTAVCSYWARCGNLLLGGFGASFSFPAWPHSRHFAPSFPCAAVSQRRVPCPVTPRSRDSPSAQPSTPGSGGSPLVQQHLNFPDLPAEPI